jgi:hypothetical protein
MGCVELSRESAGELMRLIYEAVAAAAGDKESACELFIEMLDGKGDWLDRKNAL